MIKDTLQSAVNSINVLMSECEQLQKDNDTLTDSIKKLEDEQKEAYKSFNTDTHILIERIVLNNMINEIDDVAYECDSACDSASSAQNAIEDIDTYSVEDAYNQAREAERSARRVSNKLNDLLTDAEEVEMPKKATATIKIKAVEPLAEEGTENA